MRTICTILFWLTYFISFSQQPVRHTVYFDFDSDIPSVFSGTSLAAFTEKLKSLPVTSACIYGYTDKTGSNAYNKDLSFDRAHAVAELLKAALPKGIECVIKYFGEDSLLTNEEARQDINRRVEIVVFYSFSEKEVIQVQPFYEDVEEQHYKIDLDDTVVITAKQGTKLRILPGSIQNRKKEILRGMAELIIKEYYDPGDILLAGLHTNSEKGLLQTGGMFYMTILQNGDTMSSETRKAVTVKMPVIDNTVSGNMGVFTMNHVSDTARWNNTDQVFKRLFSYWDWPVQQGKLQDLLIPDIRFVNWRIGGVFTDEYDVRGNWPWNNTYWIWPDAKKITHKIVKTDSSSLKVNLNIKFRKRGFRKFGIRDFDTSFVVKYHRAEYEGVVSTLNWINCDRFLSYPNVSDFYVSTPQFRGANVLVYFENINAFLPAYSTQGGNRYKVSGVPPGQKAWLVAFGKKENEYYLSKKKFTITANETELLELTRMNEEDFRKEMKSFK